MTIQNSFDKDYETLVTILECETISDDEKETAYNDFLSDYPYFDSLKLDKYFE